ncbi:MAG: metal-sensitive transcriptional regulator [Actinomycetota bacterium]
MTTTKDLADTKERGGMPGYTVKKKEISDRLRRIGGQIQGIDRMVEEDIYCIDVLTQVNSAVAALRSVGMLLLDEHVRHCVRDAVEAREGDAKLDELMAAVKRFAG